MPLLFCSLGKKLKPLGTVSIALTLILHIKTIIPLKQFVYKLNLKLPFCYRKPYKDGSMERGARGPLSPLCLKNLVEYTEKNGNH